MQGRRVCTAGPACLPVPTRWPLHTLLSRPARATPDVSPEPPPPPVLVLLQCHHVPSRGALVRTPTPHGTRSPAAPQPCTAMHLQLLPASSPQACAPRGQAGAVFSFTHTFAVQWTLCKSLDCQSNTDVQQFLETTD